jgi:protein-disulfide isomerase/uncharacterized membrane protein
MPRAPILVLIRVCALVALAVSAALLHDYTRPLPAFCAEGAGCDQVRQSAYSSILGVPTPVVGVLAFVALFALTLLPHERRRRLMVPVAVLGGVFGAAFLAIQALVLHVFCKLCIVVDLAAVLAAVGGVLYAWKGERGDDGAVSARHWAIAAAVAFVAPFFFGYLQPPPPVKPAILRFWQPNKVTIVELSDFQCPFCRVLHPELAKAIASYPGRVNLVRLTVPLDNHQHAKTASRAYLCAKDQGKGEVMADALFEASDMTETGCEALAGKLDGLDQAAYKKCFADPKTAERVQAERQLAQREIGFHGLPTLWIGKQQLVGARSEKDLREAIDKQLEGGDGLQPNVSPVWLWTLLMAGIGAVGVRAVRGAKRR